MSTPPTFTVRLEPDGLSFQAPAGQSLLQSAQKAGVTLPSSCQNGTCRTCLCHLASGQVAYLIDWPGVSVDERQEGWILPCVAQPQSDLVLELPR